MNSFFQDLRYALRQFRKNKGFTAVSVITLALGIGATTAIFSMVDAVLLRPLPYHDSSRLMLLHESSQQIPDMSISMANFNDWRAQNKVFESLVALQPNDVVWTNKGGEAVRLGLRRITAGFTPTLRVQPILGRALTPDDDKVGSRLHGSLRPVDLFASLWRLEDQLGGEMRRDEHHGTYAYGRLKPGVTPQQLTEMKSIATRLDQPHLASNGYNSVTPRPLLDAIRVSAFDSGTFVTGAVIRSIIVLFRLGFPRAVRHAWIR